MLGGGEATEAGRAWLAGFGGSVEPGGRIRRLFCRPCRDWNERRPYPAGRLGAALCRRREEPGWTERVRGGRAVRVTEIGRRGFEDRFGLPSPGAVPVILRPAPGLRPRRAG